MPYEVMDAPFSSMKGLGSKYVLWRNDLVIELFEYKRTGSPEEVEMEGRMFNIGAPVGETKESRKWRLTYSRPIAMRVRDEALALVHPDRHSWPAPYSFSRDSAWIAEMCQEPLFNRNNCDLVHTVFVLWDDIIEVLSDGFPNIEEMKT